MQIKKLMRPDISYIPLALCAALTVFVIYVLYYQTQDILTERLRERLKAIASTAALQFQYEDIVAIQNESDLISNELKRVIETMERIRDNNEDLRYIYIWRKTDRPYILKFVADAEMLNPIDANENGIIEDTEIPPVPGEDYDVSDTPSVLNAFNGAYALEDFIDDRWGVFLSGYAPIRDDDGNAVAVLGIDVQIKDFYRIVKAMFLPMSLLAIFLLIILSGQTFWLISIWNNRVQMAKELDKQKDELLSMVSHQMATPVSSVKWYIEMLRDGDIGELTKEQHETLSSVYSITSELSQLVAMILDVSRIQLGKIKIEKQEANLKVLFKEVVEILEPKAKEREVEFIQNIPSEFPTALLDKKYTKMIVENLLSNAIKYTPKGGKVNWNIRISGNELTCEVIDTGCGIPEKDQAHMFERQFRASNVRNSIDGNGFGLYIVKGAVEAQGGTINFESTEGKGTTFTVTLPLRDGNKS